MRMGIQSLCCAPPICCLHRPLKLPALRPLPPWGMAKEAEAIPKATREMRAEILPLRGYFAQRKLRVS